MKLLCGLLKLRGRRMTAAPSTSQDTASVSALDRSQIIVRRALFLPDRALFRRVGRDAGKQLIFGTFWRAKGGEIAMNLRTSL
jgi:hypothetical protein